MSAPTWAAAAMLGGIGAIARFLLDVKIAGYAGRAFPFGTLAINSTGGLLLGLLTGLAVTGDALVLAGTALLGSYTTFSTWMLETHRLAEDDQIPLAIGNALLSIMIGIGAATLGRAIGAHV